MTRFNIGLGILALTAGCTGEQGDTGENGMFDPNNAITCADGICVLSGTITEDTVLTPDTTWLLRGGVFIGDDVNETVLTIEAGTTIIVDAAGPGFSAAPGTWRGPPSTIE